MTWGFFSAVRLIAARSRVCNKKWRMGGCGISRVRYVNKYIL